MAKLRLLVTLLLALLAVNPLPARAQGSTTKEQFATAQKRYDAEEYGSALPLFRKVFEQSGSPNAQLYVARCLRELGKVAEAYEEMSATLQEARSKAESEPKYVLTRDAAAAELALLEPKVGKLVIALTNPEPGVEITVNGSAVPPARIGVPFAVNPGELTVIATVPGKSGWRGEVQVKAGETKTVALSFGASGPAQVAPAASSAPAPKDAPQPETQTRGGGVRTVGFVAVGLGVAGMAVFGITGAMASSKYSTLVDDCGTARCQDPKYADTIDSGKTLETVSNVGLVVGITGIVAGGVMILVGGPKKVPAQATVAAGPSGAVLGYRGTF